jgi:hypothetical protein
MRPVVLLAAVLMLVGCGVPAQDEPHAVDLPRQAMRTPSPGPVNTTGEVAEVLCLLRGNRLQDTVRRLDWMPTVQQQLDQLSAGPTQAEREQGLTSALGGMVLTDRSPPGSRDVTVQIGEADEDTARTDENLAYGQIVCTLTARADVNAVVFTRDDQRLEVPRGDGSLSSQPLRARDYAELIDD